MIIDDRIVTPVIGNATCTGKIKINTMVSKTQLTTARFAVDMMDELMTATFREP
jgi:hypothetical protein